MLEANLLAQLLTMRQRLDAAIVEKEAFVSEVTEIINGLAERLRVDREQRERDLALSKRCTELFELLADYISNSEPDDEGEEWKRG
jgi:hypothetical protein